MVEFKIDSRDNKAKLMEINPRFEGFHKLTIFAGVDLPWLCYKLGKNIETHIKGYKMNVRMSRLNQDIYSFFCSLFKKKKIRIIIDFLSSYLKYLPNNLHFDIIDIKDMRPVFQEWKNSIKRYFKKKSFEKKRGVIANVL